MFDFIVNDSRNIRPRPQIIIGQFDSWGLDIRSFREPLQRSVRQVLAPSIRKNFAVGGRPAWEPLAESTLRQKIRLGFSTEPLIRTKKLQKVATQLNIWDVTSESASVDSLPGVEYGFVHQDGYPGGNIPQRQFLTIQDQDMDDIENIFGDWVIERAAKAGLFGRGT